MKTQHKAYVFASLAVLGWATAASAFKISLRHMDFIQMLFYASFVSLIVMLIFLLVQKKLKLILKFSVKDFAFSAFLGLLNPFIYYLILFKAYELLPAQEAQPLNYTWPIMLVLLSAPILKQKLHFRSIISILISFVGVLVIATRGDILSIKFSEPKGAILALSTAVIWALYWLFNTKDKADANVRLFMNFVFGTIYTFITCLLFSDITLPTIQGLISVSWVGIFEMGLTFIVWIQALKLTESTTKVTNLIFIVPFLSLLVIHWVLKETITWSSIIGLILIVFGIAYQQIADYRNKKIACKTDDNFLK